MPDLSALENPNQWMPFPLEDGPFRLTMGLRSISEDQWWLTGPDHLQQMAERRMLLTHRPDAVLACQPSAEAAAGKVWAMLRPDAEPLVGKAALAALGREVQEDICILQRGQDDASYRLTGAVLCFPNRWRLADKLGRDMPGIHNPVPSYAESLEKPIDRFFSHLKADRIVERHNWSLHADDGLFHPEASDHTHDQAADAVTAENAGETVFMRVERQTLRRLDDVGPNTIIFTIRTMIATLADALDNDATRFTRLETALTTMPASMQRYKAMARMIPAIRAYLAQNKPSA